MEQQVPGIVGWLLASPCESSPLSPGPEWPHPNPVGLPASRTAFCFPGCQVGTVVGSGAEGRLSLAAGTWRLGAVVCPGFSKAKGKSARAVRELGRGRGPATSSGKRIASHTHRLQTVGRLPGGLTPASTCRPAVSAPICSGLRWPLTAPLFQRCWDQPVSCY